MLASQATPAPTQPPPTTTRSNSSACRRASCAARVGATQGRTVVPSSQAMGARGWGTAKGAAEAKRRDRAAARAAMLAAERGSMAR